VVDAHTQTEGARVVRRPFPRQSAQQTDPFVLLHHVSPQVNLRAAQ
jgi:hypothetical protein